MNNLVGVLHKFRRGRVAVMCHIQRMFHMFKVHESDWDYLRFLWYRDKKMEEVVEFWVTVHIFGGTSSPGSATFGLRSLAPDSCDPESKFDMQARDFIMNDFYVDDGLLSIDTAEQVVRVVNGAVTMCTKSNVRLHKFVGNDKSVLKGL